MSHDPELLLAALEGGLSGIEQASHHLRAVVAALRAGRPTRELLERTTERLKTLAESLEGVNTLAQALDPQRAAPPFVPDQVRELLTGYVDSCSSIIASAQFIQLCCEATRDGSRDGVLLIQVAQHMRQMQQTLANWTRFAGDTVELLARQEKEPPETQ